MSLVFVSVGSNIDKEANIRSALFSLQKDFGNLLVSKVYENPAVGFDGEDFYNLVIGFKTDRSPAEVANVLREVEQEHGRTRTETRFSSRTLDLDLLLYDDLVMNHKGVQVPRDEITRYAFVLGPLVELVGDMLHPQLRVPLRELWAKMENRALKPVNFDFQGLDASPT